MKPFLQTKSFSLIELMVSLTIVAIITAIIVPNFLKMRSQSAIVVQNMNLIELQKTFAEWQSQGGTLTVSPTPAGGLATDSTGAAAFLELISNPSSSRSPVSLANGQLGITWTAADGDPTGSGIMGSSSLTLGAPLVIVADGRIFPSGLASPSGYNSPGSFYIWNNNVYTPPGFTSMYAPAAMYIESNGITDTVTMTYNNGACTLGMVSNGK